MSSAAILLADTLTFLAFLHTHDIRSFGLRWLPPTALRDLNAQLTDRDTLAVLTHTRGGRRGTVERDTHRIRFIHFLCEAAHLVARTGPFLKPTLRVKHWLAAEPSDQLRQLYVAAYPAQPSRPHDELWRAYRLPGWSLASPTVALIQPLFPLLRAAPPDEKIKLTTLLKLIPLPEDGDELPDAILRGLLDQLAALGVLDWHSRAGSQAAVTLTDLGTSLIIPDSPSPALCLQPIVTLQLARQRYPLARTDFTTLYQLSDYAALRVVAVKSQRRAGVARRYQLDRSLIQRALQRGHSLDAILRFLEDAIGDALPDRLVAQLHDWAAELDRVAVRRVTLLEVKDPATLTELTRAQRIRESIQRTLSPRAVVVRESRLPALLHQLDRRGLTPRTNLPSRQLDYSTTKRFDDPSSAQLYFAILLTQQLAAQLPAPYRVDYSLALELERALTPADRLLAIQLAEEAAIRLSAPPSGPSASPCAPPRLARTGRVGYPGSPTAHRIDRSSEFPLKTRGNDAALLTLIEHAILANRPLALTYYSPAYDQTTERIIEPLRLEWQGDVPYLIAWCRLRQDERTFRVDRILDLAPVSDPPARSAKAA